jgi:histidyl-tRNA synthetase
MSYIIPIFRYGRPQKGRLREAHQVGLELVGSSSAVADAEVIEITIRFYEALGIDDSVAMLNSLGRDECRARFREAILQYSASFLSDQPQDVRDRVCKNPLRLLDSKDPAAQEAIKSIPPITDYLEDESKSRFDRIQQLLTDANVRYQVAPEIVRGLDYYTETVFEVLSSRLGAQSSLCGGGRYDDLVKELGGPPTPSVGVAMGIERAIIVMEEAGLFEDGTKPNVFVVQATEGAFSRCHQLARDLRSGGIATLLDIDGKSMKSQLRQADKSGAAIALILGEDELKNNTVQLKKLGTSEQQEVPIDGIIDRVRQLK